MLYMYNTDININIAVYCHKDKYDSNIFMTVIYIYIYKCVPIANLGVIDCK